MNEPKYKVGQRVIIDDPVFDFDITIQENGMIAGIQKYQEFIVYTVDSDNNRYLCLEDQIKPISEPLPEFEVGDLVEADSKVGWIHGVEDIGVNIRFPEKPHELYFFRFGRLKKFKIETKFKVLRKDNGKLMSLYRDSEYEVGKWMKAPENKKCSFDEWGNDIDLNLGYFVYNSYGVPKERVEQGIKTALVIYKVKCYEQLDSYGGQPTYRYIKLKEKVYPEEKKIFDHTCDVSRYWISYTMPPIAENYCTYSDPEVENIRREAKIEVLEEIFKDANKVIESEIYIYRAYNKLKELKGE